MKIGEQYECDHLPGETLTVSHVYNERQGTVRVGTSERKIIFAKDLHSEPQLSLAHISNDNCTMRKKQGSLL